MLVSTVIPTRNRRKLVARALSSVLGQRDVEVEALVVDDGSTDDTPDWLAGLGDSRVRHLRNEESSGVARARNRGIEEARGEWVAFLDDDDLWAPTKLSAQLAACAAADAEFSYTALLVTDTALRSRSATKAPPGVGLDRALLGANVIGAPSSVMAARSLLDRAGGFDPEYSILADWDMWLRLAAAGRAAACDAPLTAYVTHDSNMHLNVAGAQEEFARLRLKHDELARRAGRKLGDHQWWGWIAAAHRRSGHRFRSAALFAWLGLRHGQPRMVGRGAGLLLGDGLAERLRARSSSGRREGTRDEAAMAWLDQYARSPDAAPAA